MGIFSSLTNEARRNFIARPEEARGDIIYRHPEKNIRMMTQLTCSPDELAVFVKEGRVHGTLGPGGTYSLDSKNVPFLSALLEKVTGGDLFISEIFFVTTREVPSLRFGGPLGQVTDVVTQMMCEAMVYGDFSAKVTDPEKLIFGLVGSGRAQQTGNVFLEWFKSILLKFLSDAVGELGEKGWSLNKMISPHFKLELQSAVLESIRDEVGRHGLEVVSFGNFVLSISDEDKAELNKRNMSIADDQRRMQLAQNPAYMAIAQAEMMRNAGVGMSKGGGEGGGGGALSGMGMGMGLQMAQMFGQQMQVQQAGQGGQAAASPQMVKCPACSAMTPPGRFCSACGQSLVAAARCECGVELPAGARFCLSCGKPVAATPKACECGTELAPAARFCPGCGKQA